VVVVVVVAVVVAAAAAAVVVVVLLLVPLLVRVPLRVALQRGPRVGGNGSCCWIKWYVHVYCCSVVADVLTLRFVHHSLWAATVWGRRRTAHGTGVGRVLGQLERTWKL
jgi:hypothetical protein